MCLSTEDCNGGQLVFQQEESIREFDGEIDSPGTISFVFLFFCFFSLLSSPHKKDSFYLMKLLVSFSF